MKGRAEYEDVRNKNLFERENPSEIFPWASSTSGRKKGILVGKRGIGKTFFIRKLAEEVPSEIYQLDKERLEYKLLEKSANPNLIAVDDLHYLMGVMRLYYLEGNMRITEKEVLGTLKDLNEKAKREHKKLLYVSDEGPFGLSFNFSEEENKKKFSELLKGCVVTSDDTNFFYRYLNELFPTEENAFAFRKYVSENLAFRLKEEFKVKEIPVIFPTAEMEEKELKKTKRGEKWYSYHRYHVCTLRRGSVFGRRKSLLDEFGILVSKYGREMITEKFLKRKSDPFGHDSYYIYYSEGKRKIEEEISWSIDWEEMIRKREEWIHLEVIPDPTLITTIRGLSILNDVYGRINRETLGVDFGELTNEGWFYTFDELLKLKRIVEEKYSEASKRLYKSMYSLIRSLLTASTEREFVSLLLRDRLSKE